MKQRQQGGREEWRKEGGENGKQNGIAGMEEGKVRIHSLLLHRAVLQGGRQSWHIFEITSPLSTLTSSPCT